jgi:hypothetical protein
MHVGQLALLLRRHSSSAAINHLTGDRLLPVDPLLSSILNVGMDITHE